MTAPSKTGKSVRIDDPYLWLEDLSGERALRWVEEQNASTLSELRSERLEEMQAEALAIMDASDKIPSVQRRGDFLYQFWRDADHPQGLWRRTTLDQYLAEQTDWETVVDVDALAAAEDENWVWAGAEVLEPEYARALILLSRGGADTVVVREFDMTTKQFVPGGFTVAEARTDISWEDDDTVLVATDFGEGSLSAIGMPLIVKRWRRGTALDQAETVFTARAGDLGAAAGVYRTPGYERTLFVRMIDNRNKEIFLLHGGELVQLDIPADGSVSMHRQWIVISVPTGWTRGDASHPSGTVLVADLDEFLSGTADLHIIYEPGGPSIFQGAVWTRDYLVVATLEDVASRLHVMTPGIWEAHPIPGVPENTDTYIEAIDPFSNEIFLSSTSLDKPRRILHGLVGGSVREIKTAPARFNADDLVVSQHFATSLDGTRIPYFLVTHRDSTGPAPTLLHGYGGFAISQLPGYLGVTGRLWVERGGNFALANIRGGGEYGPDWYFQSINAGRHRVAEDFAAVATDLIERGVTTAAGLGATGTSAGGLLMGVMLTQYPQLFGALVCGQPLLDMRRFPVLGVGAAFVAEYGNPDDPDDWEFIKQYSPYHNIDADRTYPPILITTSTNDDRVHPGHARKMTAALQAAGHQAALYESTDGGHAGASTNAQAAFETALMYEFLHRNLDWALSHDRH
ncbi:prolyl oligopeptidase family serine peptidase [Mycolicibacterium vinylchloridicum]|uniref:prolyl oligopeptidase family serine peptidase n=1 Tax=Mycolicibacterium vinylchloridicum TaxID=2736928 RepID=UPI0015C7B236|nr:prolyl oligopeptidase family serine peptidase [Mycolicibacterium vinylchloridicum]